MIRFLARRTAALVTAVLLASFVVFLIPYLTPGDPVRKIIRSRVAGDVIDDSSVQALSAELGLHDPLWKQYLGWLGNLAGGDMGLSHTSRTPVIDQVLPALGITVSIVIMTLLVAAVVSLVLGATAALHEGRTLDRWISAVTQAFIAIPEYWLAPLLVLVFSLQLAFLPSAGWSGPSSAVLPVTVLALRPTSFFTSAVREGVLQSLGSDHVAAARSRGMSRTATMMRHVIPNGLLPLTTSVAIWFAGLLGGSVIVEVMFSIPGMGRLLFDGVINSDIPVAQGAVVVVVALAVLLTTAADLVHTLLNPRMRSAVA
ncbi:peptide/nickel transport system permease protein [Pseudarthrobacter enclensis]|uniref:ABC transporter permease n=1 Tax=Pseudarthrobacter enclensis TaxID=993070 RepID=A0A0V8IS58_9MICC|nr:ABC transporter permease [Pseudarthrobacter enclensis]KSU77591.1 ABC transporter permease [Pseudarthrobacter enclensis]SCB91157.1 peptide/nickel transport system permease protein [Pseudarthrobacter enclensis]